MALFDLEVTVSQPSEIKGISEDARDQLFQKPSVESSKPKEAGIIPVAEAESEEVGVELELDEIGEAYGELIIMADGLLDRLAERSEKLVFHFDPEQHPELAAAVGAQFAGINNKITFKMYLDSLRADKDLAVAIGEAEHGHLR